MNVSILGRDREFVKGLLKVKESKCRKVGGFKSIVRVWKVKREWHLTLTTFETLMHISYNCNTVNFVNLYKPKMSATLSDEWHDGEKEGRKEGNTTFWASCGGKMFSQLKHEWIEGWLTTPNESRLLPSLSQTSSIFSSKTKTWWILHLVSPVRAGFA